MKVYTYSEARQQLAALLDRARREGAVRIRRRDGSAFLVQPDVSRVSPLDVPAARLGLRRDEIVALVREGRERASGGDAWDAGLAGTGASLSRDGAAAPAPAATRRKPRRSRARARR